jgi:hypothetical protein
MKKLIQELIEEIQYWKEKAPLGSAFKDCLIILEGSATNKLEKEKEQIKSLVDALEDIINWNDDLEEYWGDAGYRAKDALKNFNQNK